MSEALLIQILGELKDIKTEQQEMKADIQDIKTEQQEMKADFQGVKADIKRIEKYAEIIPLLNQAILENLELTKELEASQRSFEEKITAETKRHDISIDLLVRRQFQLEVEIAKIKNR